MFFGSGLDAGAASRVAGVLAHSLGWDDAENHRQTAAYQLAAARVMAFRPEVSEVATQDR